MYLKREESESHRRSQGEQHRGQALLAKRMGKTRIIAETGAGQHGVAAATVAARLGLTCVVYMEPRTSNGRRPTSSRMKLLGAEVVSVESGRRPSRTPSTKRCATG